MVFGIVCNFINEEEYEFSLLNVSVLITVISKDGIAVVKLERSTECDIIYIIEAGYKNASKTN